MSNETSFKSDIKVENDIFYQKDSKGDDIDDQNETNKDASEVTLY